MRTERNAPSLKTSHRKLVVRNLPRDLAPGQLLLKLSEYGRVEHFDMPLDVRKRATKEEIKEKFRNSKNLIRITEHKNNGSTEVEYYPEPESMDIDLTSV